MTAPDLTTGHPAVEEVRRHWGLAVDIHRRPERLAEFDRMIRSLKAEAWQEGAMDHAAATSRMTPETRRIINELMRAANPYLDGGA